MKENVKKEKIVFVHCIMIQFVVKMEKLMVINVNLVVLVLN